MSTDPTVIRPKLHHVNFKTNLLQAMIDWYATLLGTEVLFQHELGPGSPTTRPITASR